MNIKIFLLVLLSSLMFLNACAYRADLPQGNFTEQKDVYKLHKGMTMEQVQYVLGTPMLLDDLDNKKWYYINYLRQGWSDPTIMRLIVSFDNNQRLLDISGDFKKNPNFNEPL